MSSIRKVLVRSGCLAWALPRRTIAFTPSPPPGTHGAPVFPDLDLSSPTDDSRRRKEDSNAVMVVTGASRGIGLQFVKTLSEQSQVRQSFLLCQHATRSAPPHDKPTVSFIILYLYVCRVRFWHVVAFLIKRDNCKTLLQRSKIRVALSKSNWTWKINLLSRELVNRSVDNLIGLIYC